MPRELSTSWTVMLLATVFVTLNGAALAGAPVVLQGIDGTTISGELISCGERTCIIEASVGTIEIPFEKIAVLQFNAGSVGEAAVASALGLPGYTVAPREGLRLLKSGSQVRVFLFFDDETSTENARKYLKKKARKSSLDLELTTKAEDADVIVVRLRGTDQVVSSTTRNKSYIDIHGGGGLKSAPVTAVKTTVTMTSYILWVDHDAKTLTSLGSSNRRESATPTKHGFWNKGSGTRDIDVLMSNLGKMVSE